MPKLARLDAQRNEKVRGMILHRLPRGASVLEISCGHGELLASLHADGYEVRGTNFTHYPTPDTVPVDEGVDVMDRLPYGDGRFDAVVVLDVMEHLSDHPRALRELARVLQADGLLIVATPNMMNIASRLHFLFTGFFKTKRSFVGFDLPPERAFAFHNYPLHLPVFLYQLRAHGLTAAEMAAVQVKAKSLLFWLLLAPAIAAMTWYRIQVLEKYLKRTEDGRALFRWLVSFPALCGEVWVLLAQKRPAGAPAKPGPTPMPAWYHGQAAADANGEKPPGRPPT